MIACIWEHSQSRWQTGLMLISTCLIRQSVFCMQMREHFRFIINHKLSVTPFQTSQWFTNVIIEWLLPSAVDVIQNVVTFNLFNNYNVTLQWKKEVKVTYVNSAWVKVSEIKCIVISVLCLFWNLGPVLFLCIPPVFLCSSPVCFPCTPSLQLLLWPCHVSGVFHPMSNFPVPSVLPVIALVLLWCE